jgi:hypothetical protein
MRDAIESIVSIESLPSIATIEKRKYEKKTNDDGAVRIEQHIPVGSTLRDEFAPMAVLT